jgi:hypothetical protein
MDENTDFYFAWPETVEIQATVDWSLPHSHDVLFAGMIDADQTAYFYAIIALHEKKWWPYYIGKVFAQTASQRHRATDHIARLAELRKLHPTKNFHISLGTPTFGDGCEDPDPATIDDIEGLLIICNWSDKMINKRRIERFVSTRQISIENTGHASHLYKRAAYGVFFAHE